MGLVRVARRSKGSPPSSGVPSHIASAAAGQWTAIGTNQLQNVAFNYTTSPWPISGFSTNLRSIMDDWSGATYDSVRHKLYVHGGGHSGVSGYSGNDVYCFDLATATWSRLDNPSAYAEGDANAAGIYPDNGPLPIHTYSMWCVNPVSGLIYRLGVSGSICDDIAEFNPSTATQQAAFASKTWWTYRAAVSWQDGSGAGTVWMPDEGKFLIASHNMGSNLEIRRYDPTANTVSSSTSGGASASVDKSVAYSQARRLALIHRFNSGPYCSFDCVTNTPTSRTITGATLPDRLSIEFDPVRDRFIGYTDEQADTRKLYSIHPDTWVATEIAPTTGATPPASQGNGLHGRFRYCSDYDVFIMSNRVDGSVYLYKPAGWSAP